MSICSCGGSTKSISSKKTVSVDKKKSNFLWVAEECKACARVSFDEFYIDDNLVARGYEARVKMQRQMLDMIDSEQSENEVEDEDSFDSSNDNNIFEDNRIQKDILDEWDTEEGREALDFYYTEIETAMLGTDNDIISPKGTVFLDTETTGFGYKNSIIELSIVDITGEVLFDRLIKPVTGRDKDFDNASKIHGITRLDLNEAKEFHHYQEEIIEILYGKRVIIYNASFDKTMLSYHGIELDLIANEVICAQKRYRNFIYNTKEESYKLENAISAIGSSFKGKKHRALSDAIGTLEVWNYMEERECLEPSKRF